MAGKKILNQLSAYQQGMQVTEVQKKYKLEQIIKLASNENPYGFSKGVTKLFQEMANEFEIYPDGYAFELRKRLAQKLSINETQLVFGNGSDEIITFICRAFLYPGTNTVMAAATFPQYRHHSLIEGADIKEIPTQEGKHDLDKMADAIDEHTKVVWICLPDNPTGTLILPDEFETFMDRCPKDVLVVVDEAYVEFVAEKLKLALHKDLDKYPNLILLRTFSKIYGLAGLRVGYGIACT